MVWAFAHEEVWAFAHIHRFHQWFPVEAKWSGHLSGIAGLGAD
jgi:hypothetical protein